MKPKPQRKKPVSSAALAHLSSMKHGHENTSRDSGDFSVAQANIMKPKAASAATSLWHDTMP
jgi:hypothetical protein